MKKYRVHLFTDDDTKPGREVILHARNLNEAEGKALDRFPFYDTAVATCLTN